MRKNEVSNPGKSNIYGIMKRRIVYACSYKRLLTNRLHGKAAELELANS